VIEAARSDALPHVACRCYAQSAAAHATPHERKPSHRCLRTRRSKWGSPWFQPLATVHASRHSSIRQQWKSWLQHCVADGQLQKRLMSSFLIVIAPVMILRPHLDLGATAQV